jgi:hypothetical protein
MMQLASSQMTFHGTRQAALRNIGNAKRELRADNTLQSIGVLVQDSVAEFLFKLT